MLFLGLGRDVALQVAAAAPAMAWRTLHLVDQGAVVRASFVRHVSLLPGFNEGRRRSFREACEQKHPGCAERPAPGDVARPMDREDEPRETGESSEDESCGNSR